MHIDIQYTFDDFTAPALSFGGIRRAVAKAPPMLRFWLVLFLLSFALLVASCVWLMLLRMWICSLALIVPLLFVFAFTRAAKQSDAGLREGWVLHPRNSPSRLNLGEDGIMLVSAQLSELMRWESVEAVILRRNRIDITNKHAAFRIPSRVFRDADEQAQFVEEICRRVKASVVEDER